MNTLALFLNRIASWKSLVFLLILYVSFPAYFLKNAEETINQKAGKIIGPIDLTVGYNPERTLQMVSAYGNDARDYYATGEMTVDVVYPLVYALFFGVILALLFRKKAYSPPLWANALPFLMQGFDYLENISIIILLKSFPDVSKGVAIFCEIAKLIKWLLAVATLSLIVYGLIRLVMSKLQEK